jgi:alpha-ribazole phosphatase
MLLTLIRHGEVEGRPWVFRGRTDSVLSPEGWENLHKCVLALPHTFKRIISSDLRRCSDFAQEWARAIGAHCDLEQRFREIDFGAWEDLTPAEVETRFAQEFAYFRARPESWPGAGGESFVQFRQRVTEALGELHAHGPNDHFALVTHAGVIRLIISMSLRISYTSALQLDVRYASVRQVWYEPPPLACGAGELTKVI